MMPRYDHDNVVPYKASGQSKKDQVAEMFNDIAPRYDFLNRFLSAGIDVIWRKKALLEFKTIRPNILLDVATGTADLAIMANRMLHTEKIIGIDISEKMLAIGREKLNKAGLASQIDLQSGDSEAINFTDGTFDAVTVAFGVRNFENLEKGLREIYRVLRPGGKLVVLEFSKPKTKGIQQLYTFYMGMVAPEMGKIFSSNKEAYRYLNDSVMSFPEGERFTDILKTTGFKETSCKRLSFGICSIYCGIK
jgi:demethylmenaquinone methyltransferase/2-methoxy-6-polyprenyl-1,4-benzoquinol methylase